MRECLFCDYKIESNVRKTTVDRLMAAHFDEYHEKEIAPLTVAVGLDRKLLPQFGDLIERFEDEIEKRQRTVDLMKDLSATFRQRIDDAERGIDHRLIDTGRYIGDDRW